MLAELKTKSQVTIPKAVVNELGLEQGDMFEVVVTEGVIRLIPVVVYPKSKIIELEERASNAKRAIEDGSAEVFDSTDDFIASLHRESKSV